MNDSLFRSINPERFLQVKRKQEQFSYQEFFSQKKLQQEDHGAVCLITNEQVVTIENDHHGAGSHTNAFFEVICTIYNIDGPKTTSITDSSVFALKRIYQLLDQTITMRIVHEGAGDTYFGSSYILVIFPESITFQQYELLKAYTEKYRPVLEACQVCHPKFIVYSTDHSLTNYEPYFEKSLEFASHLINPAKEIIADQNLIGETLSMLKKKNKQM